MPQVVRRRGQPPWAASAYMQIMDPTLELSQWNLRGWAW